MRTIFLRTASEDDDAWLEAELQVHLRLIDGFFYTEFSFQKNKNFFI